MYGLAVLSLAVLAGQAAASAISGTSLAALLKRQATAFDPSEIPPQCQSACSTILNTLNTCVDVNCLCSDIANKGLYDCLECALTLDPSPSIMSQAQSSLDEYASTCTQAGVKVTPQTLTLPPGPATTGGSQNTNVGSNPTLTGTGASNPTTKSPSTGTGTIAPAQNTATINTNPLGAGSSAGMVGVSVASVMGAVAAAAAVLAL